MYRSSLNPLWHLLFTSGAAVSSASARSMHPSAPPSVVTIRLSEWKVELVPATIHAGRVQFRIANLGSIPHAFEIEGTGTETATGLIQPGASDSLTLTLQPGGYSIYCPVGADSHRKLGMATHLTVAAAPSGRDAGPDRSAAAPPGSPAPPAVAHSIRVTGGGPVIQILPGPFPFPDSAGPILQAFGAEHEGLESQMKDGPYSNKVTPISGRFTIAAWDLGSVRDSIDGAAEFTSQDGSRWRLVLDRVQTTDVPHHPKFGGVIMGLYYHGSTQVHTPLVPTINSKVALWAIGHLFRNDGLVTDHAMVHVMLLSRTRRVADFALECWDCSKNPVEELQLQILPGPGEPGLDAPGGFLFVNWEKSTSRTPAR